MSFGSGFSDVTPAPTPTPKRHWLYAPQNGAQPIQGASGQTLGQAIQAGLPPGMLGTVLPVNVTIVVVIDVTEN